MVSFAIGNIIGAIFCRYAINATSTDMMIGEILVCILAIIWSAVKKDQRLWS